MAEALTQSDKSQLEAGARLYFDLTVKSYESDPDWMVLDFDEAEGNR